MVTLVAGTFLLAVVVHAVGKLILAIIGANKTKRAIKDFDGPTPHWLYGNINQVSIITGDYENEKYLYSMEKH